MLYIVIGKPVKVLNKMYYFQKNETKVFIKNKYETIRI